MAAHSRAHSVLVFLLVALLIPLCAAQTAGDVLLPAPKGSLDIHHINTGNGNAALLILPDRTTLLIDCGASPQSERPPGYLTPRTPDTSRLPGEWVARYVKRIHPRGEAGVIDYAVISHFHSDHMGGIPELLRHVRIDTVLDRGWPDYQQPPLPPTGPFMIQYLVAVKEQRERHGMKVERIRAGAADQIVLRYEREQFPQFEVRNLAVNGEIWTGEGTEVRRRFPVDEQAKKENASSTALRVRHGRFDYFTGGDMTGPSPDPASPEWPDVESAVAWVTGPVDVAVANHHGLPDATGAFFLSVLQPRVHIVQVWGTPHLNPNTLERMLSPKLYPGPRDVFATNGMWKDRTTDLVRVYGEALGRRHAEMLQKHTTAQGHIVVRVAPGGDRYRIFMLDDSDESMRIRSVHGPYESR
jgi:beta-lactamase superfamily II metal-dependent hydrolase